MSTNNIKYVDFFRNEEFLSQHKASWEERFGAQVKNFDYIFITHVIPDKKKKEELAKQFYVEFILSHGHLKYNVVQDSKPKKPQYGWIWRGTPENWKTTFEIDNFTKLKKVLKISQFQTLNMEAVFELNGLFFGHLFGFAKSKGYIGGDSTLQEPQIDTPSNQPNQPNEQRPAKTEEELNQEIYDLSVKIMHEGWQPDLGRQLGFAYFDRGKLQKAEEEFFQYLSHTKKNDVPVFIYMKWLSEHANSMELKLGGEGNQEETIFSMTPEEMKKLYEDAKKNYLQKYQK